MNYISIAELNTCITNNLYKIPRDIDIVVGIPRSGVLVATMIALYLNKPLCDLKAFLEHRIYESGSTKNLNKCIKEFSQIKKALIIDDSVSTGKSLLKAKNQVNEKIEGIELIYLAPYVEESSKKMVDIFFEIVEQPRRFEWNLMHHNGLINACVDIDGVLCIDPREEENDDGKKYKEFILNARPKYIPTAKIGYIVTSRLEKYRKLTEEWLLNNNIEYNELIMMNINNAEERRKLGNHAQFKAEVYKSKKDANLFIESEREQASEIAIISGKPVICVGNSNIYKKEIKVYSCIIKKIKKIVKKFLGKNGTRIIKNIFYKRKN